MSFIRKVARDLSPPLITRIIRNSQPEQKKPHEQKTILKTDEYHPGTLACFISNPVFSVPAEKFRYVGGVPYNYERHHFMKYYKHGIDALYSHFDRHQPKNLFEIHHLPSPDNYPYQSVRDEKSDYHQIIPWLYAEYTINRKRKMNPKYGNQSWGPTSPKRIELEARRLDKVLQSIRENGFQPLEHDGYPSGYFLLDTNGEWVFVVKIGLHRIAALIHLGHDSIPVQFRNNYPRLVKGADCANWPRVQDGSLTAEQAYAIFKQYFS